MIRKANISWRAKQISKMMGNGTIVTNNVVQRGEVWDRKRKSLLVHSMLVGYPIGPIYAMKNESIYDALDGKQRLTTIASFRNGDFKLSDDTPPVEVEMDYGMDTVEIAGMTYDELPEAARDAFDDYSVTVYYFDELTDEEVNEMFFRLNNNVPLSAIELTRVKAKSIKMVREIAQHELFTSGLTKAAMAKYANEDIVMKGYVLLQSTETDLSTKTVRHIMEEAEFTEEDKQRLEDVFDAIFDAYSEEEHKRTKKRIVTRIHLISLIPIVDQCLSDGFVERDVLIDWIHYFFSPTKEASVSEEYNKYVGSGSARKEAVMGRYEAMAASLNEYVKEHQ